MKIKNLEFELNQDLAIYLQIYQRYKNAIRTGLLVSGDRIPSIRSLASELNLSHGTIEQSYQMLISEGYFDARGPAGTFISNSVQHLENSSQHHQDITGDKTSAKHPQMLKALQLGVPALDAFPRKTWMRLSKKSLSHLDSANMMNPDPQGHFGLRHEIAKYLNISRGIKCSEQQIFITSGYHSALTLICYTLFQSGDLGWFENPGYYLARNFLQTLGMQLVPVPVDEQGLNVKQGKIYAPNARFAVVTPTHQSPLGVTMPLSRRLELLKWANQNQAFIIEDDYDSEFRYYGHPIPALKSLDQTGRVLYTGTLSKTLFPSLRLAYLVVPEENLDAFQRTAQIFPCHNNIFQQMTVSHFIEQGYFSRHIRKMRNLYAIRRQFLIDALTQSQNITFQIQPRMGGMHLLVQLNQQGYDHRLVEYTKSQNFGMYALSDWYMGSAASEGFLMGFTNITSLDEAKSLILDLEKLWKDHIN